MINPDQYIKEGLKIVKMLISQGNLVAGLNACQELLRVNPYHEKIHSYLRTIEKRILEENERKVDIDLDSTMHLWDEGRFEDLLKIYTRLYQFAPQHHRLGKLLHTLNEKLTNEQKKNRQETIRNVLQTSLACLKEGRYAESIQSLNELLSVDPLNSEAQKLLKEAKEKLISHKLKENEYLAESSDFQRALELYESLLSIDPDNKELRRRIFIAQSHLAEQKLLASKIHLNESISRMKDFFKQGQYENVLQACEEIDRLDPGNFAARLYKRKTHAALTREINEMMDKKGAEMLSLLKVEYEKNPEAFVKV